MADFAPTTAAKLNREHAEYTANAGDFRRIGLLHAGGIQLARNAGEFLEKRPKEPGDVFAIRKNQFWNQDILGAIIGWYTSKLFRQAPQIKTPTDQDWSEWLNNCDRKRTPYKDYFTDVFKTLALYKTAHVLVDLPRRDEDVADLRTETEQGLNRPYIVEYQPENVIAWGDDEFGELNWVLIRCDETAAAAPMDDSPMREVSWYYYDRQNYAVWQWKGPSDKYDPTKSEAVLVANGQHFLAKQNRCPVTRIRLIDSLWLGNRVYLQVMQFLQQLNSYSWSLYNSNFPIPVIIGPFEEKSILQAEWSFLHLPDPSSSIAYMEPGGQSHEHSANFLHALREEIYRVVYLQAQGRSSAATPASQSGYSKEMDMAPSTDVLNAFGDVMRQAMTRILQDVAIARGLPEQEISVAGFRFDKQTAYGEIALARDVKDLGINSPTFERIVDGRVVTAYLEDAEAAIVESVLAEVKSNPTAAEQAQAEQKLQQAAIKDSFKNTSLRALADTAASGEQGAVAA